jgi:hypothetical protein
VRTSPAPADDEDTTDQRPGYSGGDDSANVAVPEVEKPGQDE